MTSTPDTHPTAGTANIRTVRRFIDEILNRGRFELLPDVIHDGYRYVGPDGAGLVGREALADLLRGFRSGFSDLHAHVQTAVVADDVVAMTMTLTGTHDGDFDGIPPTGARLELPLAIFTRILDGRIVEDREFYDTGTMLAQLGLSPVDDPAEAGDGHGRR